MSYFKPLRRKMGFVTMTLTCVFVAAWLQSLYASNLISIDAFESSPYLKLSPEGMSFWIGSRSAIEISDDELTWFFLGFNWLVADRIYPRLVHRTIPYYSVVLPLTALSVYLILSNPRIKLPLPDKIDGELKSPGADGYSATFRYRCGVVTLITACIFAAGWLRGLFVIDQLAVRVTHDPISNICTEIHLTSYGSGLRWEIDSATGFGSVFHSVWDWDQTYIRELHQFVRFDVIDDRDIDWHWHLAGVHIASRMGKEGGFKSPDFRAIITPYWSLVVPLILLSAYLLLRKPSLKRSAAIQGIQS